MIPSLSQETITEYASDAQTIQEPTGTDYTQGVRVGKTVPAKWWNWLFKGATRRLGQAKTDAQNMLTEMQNVVTDAGFTLSASDSHQMSKSVVKDADTQIDKYVEDKKAFLVNWKNTCPQSFEYGTGNAMTCVHITDGVLCSVVHKDNYNGGNSHTVVLTKDLINWWPVDIPNDTSLYSTSGTQTVVQFTACGLIHFAGCWFLVIAQSTYNSNNSGAYALLKSLDLQHWETIFSGLVSEWDVFGRENVVATTLNGKLYFHDKVTTDGITWENAPSGSLPLWSAVSNYPVYQEPVIINGIPTLSSSCFKDGKWQAIAHTGTVNTSALAGRLITFTELTDGSFLFLCCSGGLEDSGDIDFRYTNRRSVYHVDSSLSQATSIVGGYYADLIGHSAYAIKSSDKKLYCYDGTQLTEVPTIADVPVMFKGRYYSRSSANNTKLLVSDDLVQWTEAGTIPEAPVDSQDRKLYTFTLSGAGYDAGLILYGRYFGAPLPFVEGQLNINNDTVFCSPICFKLQGAFCCISNRYLYTSSIGSQTKYKLYIAVTYNNINRVIGHTLYLR